MKTGQFFLFIRTLFNCGAACTTSVATVFLLSKGISYVELGTIWSVYLFVASITDFPTGGLADIIGRKKTFALGSLFNGVSQIVYGLAPNYSLLILAAILSGLGSAQVSGSLQAWLVDELQKENRRKQVGLYFGKARAYGSIGKFIIGLLIGLLMKNNLKILFLISGFIYICTAVVSVLFFNDNYGDTKKGISISKKAILHFIKSRPLIMFSLIMTIYYLIYTVFIFIYQPRAIELGLKVNSLGYLQSLNAIFMGLGSYYVGKLSLRIKPKILLISSYCIFFISLVFMSAANLQLFLGGVVFFFLATGMYFPIYKSWSNEYISSSVRASVMSLLSTIASGFNVLFQVLVGWAIKIFGSKTVLLAISLTCLISIMLIYVIALENSKNKSFLKT
ncbi:hypothetical protein BBF96_14815 [Anoxybacter fermentans]|uniref:Major facilitator superfamily (MFS) profile domain-containing protein n=1 Tax=Anoxybacter fermentans TaxID=1323375 RepID=A0A3Q9HSG2_9FIRM|nr:MFS transporter [Anoxybacter fermentans]AZR74546.1 hypothetical protein BBF96_14815 [Anoxybacter fermentans]